MLINIKCILIVLTDWIIKMGDKKTIKNKENYQPMKKTVIHQIDYM